MPAVATAVGAQGPAQASSPLVIDTFTIAMDNSYPTGGEALDLTATPIDVEAGRALHVTFGDGWQGYTPIWDFTNGKIILERTGAINLPRELVPNTTDVSAIVAGVMHVWHT